MTVPVVRKRTKRTKSRTRCRTCKSRHVRCDEGRPACQRCISSGRECGGYEVNVKPPEQLHNGRLRVIVPSEASATAIPLSRALSTSSVKLSANDGFAINLLRGQTTFQLPGWSMAAPWEDLALCLSQSETTIASGIVALDTLLRARGLDRPMCAYSTFDSDQHNVAIRHYSRTIADVRAHIAGYKQGSSDSQIEIVLVSCIIFICFDVLQGSYEQAAQHLQTGLKVLDEYVNAAEPIKRTIRLKRRPTAPIEVIAHAFVSLDHDLSMFGTLAPYLQATTEGEEDILDSLDDARLHLNALANAVHKTRGDLLDPRERHMRSLGLQTGDEVFDHCWVQASYRTIDLSSHAELQERISATERRVAAWSRTFACLGQPSDRTGTASHMMLQVLYMTIWLLLIWRDRDETKTDQYLPVFKHIVTLAEQLLLLRPDPQHPETDLRPDGTQSIWRNVGRGGGMIMALHLIAQKCRDSLTRFKAVSLLEELQLQEGLLSSNLIAPFARKIAELEEERARTLTGICHGRSLRCEDVPESARFTNVTIIADLKDPNFGRVVYAVWPENGSDRIELKEERLRIVPQ